MPPESTNIEDIFGEALAKVDAVARAAYLDLACATDTSLRQRFDALLAAHDAAANFLKLPDPDHAHITETPGTKIGRYKLLEQIGEGGFGVVFMARQEEPVRRTVALKIIKLGMDTKQVIARFEAERQALAMMDHPNIAKVLDAGSTDTGRPYFVMELVKGIPLTTYCDSHNLTIIQRLELFIPVCHAIQHAHQKGIIHRDLKPSNVLVTRHDDRPVPMVIDFGVAKATQDKLTEKTLFTGFRQLIGTPSYMSPEQAQLGGIDIDTRSDIYSLGALLYELLAGSPPFEPDELRQKAFAEMQRILREVDPTQPSTRLSTLNADAQSLRARERQSDPKRLAHTMRGELDWIVMRCLEKDRARRYATANALAEDLQRYLRDEPVQARRPTRLYRLRTFIRRNKVAFTATASMILALIIGLAASTWMYWKEKQANTRVVIAEQAQSDFLQKAEAAQWNAQTEAAKSRQVAQFLKDMLYGINPTIVAGQDASVIRAILDRTNGRVQSELVNQPAVAAELLGVIGAAYVGIGESGKGESAYRQALIIQRKLLNENDPALAETLFGLGGALTYDKPEEAEALYREALKIRRAVYGNEHATVAACLNNITGPLVQLKKFAEAEACSRESLAMTRRLSGNENRDVARSLRDLGLVLHAQGKLTEAEASLREGLAMYRKFDNNPDTEVAYTLDGLSDVLADEGKLEEAEFADREALAIQIELYDRANPTITNTSATLIAILQKEGKLDEMESLLHENIERSPSTNGLAWQALGQIALHRGDKETALQHFSRAAELAPENANFAQDRAALLLKTGRSLEYQQYCHELLDRFSQTQDYIVASSVAGTCTKGTLPPEDLERAYALADFAAQAKGPAWFLPWLALGEAAIALHRGRIDSAIEWNNRAINDPNVVPKCQAWALLGQARILASVGQIPEAQTALARADALIAQHNSPPSTDLGWEDVLWSRPPAIAELTKHTPATKP